MWWFKSWLLGIPSTYFVGIVLSVGIYLAGGLLPGTTAWTERLVRWGIVFALFLLPTVATIAVTSIGSRRRVAVPEGE